MTPLIAALLAGALDVSSTPSAGLELTYLAPRFYEQFSFEKNTDGNGFGVRGEVVSGRLALGGEYQESDYGGSFGASARSVGLGYRWPSSSGLFAEYRLLEFGPDLVMRGPALRGRFAQDILRVQIYGELAFSQMDSGSRLSKRATTTDAPIYGDFRGQEFALGLLWRTSSRIGWWVEYRVSALRWEDYGASLRIESSDVRAGVRVFFGRGRR